MSNELPGTKKLVLKTAGITLAAAIVLFALVTVIMIFAAPAKTAAIATDLRLFGAATDLQERAYEKDPSVNNLGILIDYASAANDNARLETYCPAMLEHADFAAYRDFRNAKKTVSVTGEYGDYVSGTYAVALYKNGKKNAALDAVRNSFGAEYGQNSAAEYLLFSAMEQPDLPVVSGVVELLTAQYDKIVAASGANAGSREIAKDIAFAYSGKGLNNPANYELWLSRTK